MMLAPNFRNTDLPFPWKLHMMLEHAQQHGLDAIVSWMPSGKAFKVHNRDIFSKRVLPQFFRHSNFKSFQRNLSVYQFTRMWTGPESGSYSHRFFIREDRTLCQFIVRQSKPTKIHSKANQELKDDSGTSEESGPKPELGSSKPGGGPGAEEKKKPAEEKKKPSKRQRKGLKTEGRQGHDAGQHHESSTGAGIMRASPVGTTREESALVIPNEIFEQNSDTIMWMYESGFTSADLLDMLDVNKKKASGETSTTVAGLLDTKPHGVRPRWSRNNSIDDIYSLLRNIGEDDHMNGSGGGDLLDRLWKQTLGQGGASNDTKYHHASRTIKKSEQDKNKKAGLGSKTTAAQTLKLAHVEPNDDGEMMLMDDAAMIFPQDQGTLNVPFLTEGDPFGGPDNDEDALGGDIDSDDFVW
jgi:hypothetical protein